MTTLCGRHIRACENWVKSPLLSTCYRLIHSAFGLGSSSTCVIAGIAAAMTESHGGWDPERALDFACHFEGHPDNVAPAILWRFDLVICWGAGIPLLEGSCAVSLCCNCTAHG